MFKCHDIDADNEDDDAVIVVFIVAYVAWGECKVVPWTQADTLALYGPVQVKLLVDYSRIRSKAEGWTNRSLNVNLLLEQLVGIYLIFLWGSNLFPLWPDVNLFLSIWLLWLTQRLANNNKGWIRELHQWASKHDWLASFSLRILCTMRFQSKMRDKIHPPDIEPPVSPAFLLSLGRTSEHKAGDMRGKETMGGDV